MNDLEFKDINTSKKTCGFGNGIQELMTKRAAGKDYTLLELQTPHLVTLGVTLGFPQTGDSGA